MAPGTLDRVFMAMEAAGELAPGVPFSDVKSSPRAALSLADFFEGLLEKGACSEAYSAILYSLGREPAPMEEALGIALRGYEKRRNGLYPASPDRLVSEALAAGAIDRFRSYVFFGIYDMNPLQKRLAARIIASPRTESRWFTPLSPGPAHDLGIASGTLAMLESGIQASRPEWDVTQGSFAAFGENLVTRGSGRVPESEFGLIRVDGCTGAARAVLDEVAKAAGRGVPLSGIAVVGRKSQTAPIARQALAEGIPLALCPEIALSDLPAGALAGSVLEALEKDAHHLYLRRIVSTGALRDSCSPSEGEIDGAVFSTGLRSRLGQAVEAIGETGGRRLASLLEHLGDTEALLKGRPVPSRDIPRILSSIRAMADEVPGAVLESCGAGVESRWERPVDRDVFVQSLALGLETTVFRLGKPDRSGLRILDLEDARGLEFDTTIVVGLEEGVLPSTVFDDPRLSPDLRAGLGIPSAAVREKEEGFLLALSCGSATRRLVFVQRKSDEKGSPVQASPLLQPILPRHGEPDPPWLLTGGCDAKHLVFGGASPGQGAVVAASEGLLTGSLPFLREGLEAEMERLGGREIGRYDGLLSAEAAMAVSSRGFSPTLLERWVRCPFRCLAEKVWRLEQPPEAGLSISPDPMTRGTILHSVIEDTLDRFGFEAREEDIRLVIGEDGGCRALPAVLGSDSLYRAFVDDSVKLVKAMIGLLGEPGAKLVGIEKPLSLDICGVKLSGRADLLMETRNGLAVMDIKTSAPPGRERLLEDIRVGREFQVPLYCAALEREGARPDRGGYAHMGAAPRVIVFEGDELAEIVGSALRNAERVISLITKGFFFPLPPGACSNCPWQTLCRSSGSRREWILEKVGRHPELSWMIPAIEEEVAGDA
jgi:hypothetical protein